VSLLLDALKRAEQEKRARQGEREPVQEPIPAPEVEPARAPAPAKLLELESVVVAQEPSPTIARAARDREAAQAVFTAKKPAASRSRNVMIAIGALAFLVLAGGAIWVWKEINGIPQVALRGPSAPRPVVPAPSAETLKPEGASAASAPAAPGAAPDPVASAPRARQTEAEQMVMSLLKESAAVPPAPLKLTRTLVAPRVSPEVSQGYEALRAGDLTLARTRYDAAIAIDPFNLDAFLGLATVAARSGDRSVAAGHYRRVLELDPKNAPALAGLASLADYSRPESLEAQMRADLTRHPRSAPLNLALGNLYAAQSRWSDAQAAYFEAFRLSPDDADIAYNLAVSLDHLGQSRPASDYYQRALAAARGQAPQFDRALVQRRLTELAP
jgi:Tfp pilus assembly protein PilF